jgi:AcrR family transcriptional regulator
MQRPRQARSKARLAALARATEQVLRRTVPEDVTVGELAREAGVSAAYLYTRFDNKAALLDGLIDEFENGQREKAARLLEPGLWRGVGLDERFGRLANQFANAAAEHRGLMRAIFSRRVIRGLADDSDGGASFGASHQILEWLLECRDEVAHDNPRDALRLALLVLFSTLQVGLFMDLDETTRHAIATEVAGMVVGYLRDGGGPLPMINGGLERDDNN